VRLARRDGSPRPSARALFAELAPLLRAARREGRLRQFWFLHKAPDLRLRFFTRAPAALARRLEATLRRCQARRVVRSWSSSVYEPETFQFGGPEAMALVHAHFDRDAHLALAWDARARLSRTSVTTTLLSTALLNDLFLRAVAGAEEEAWDVWCNLAALHGPPGLPPAAPAVPSLTIASLLPLVSAGEGRLLRGYAHANRRLAAGLRRLWLGGHLRCGLRALLPFVALFHWNRFALDHADTVRICAAMCAALDPKRGLRGASPEIATTSATTSSTTSAPGAHHP
jgi:thiopeptide-type bacteriocin biosynthesis protein